MSDECRNPMSSLKNKTISSIKSLLKTYLLQQSYWLCVWGGGGGEEREGERGRERELLVYGKEWHFFSSIYFVSCNGPCTLKEKWHRSTEKNTLLLSSSLTISDLECTVEEQWKIILMGGHTSFKMTFSKPSPGPSYFPVNEPLIKTHPSFKMTFSKPSPSYFPVNEPLIKTHPSFKMTFSIPSPSYFPVNELLIKAYPSLKPLSLDCQGSLERSFNVPFSLRCNTQIATHWRNHVCNKFPCWFKGTTCSVVSSARNQSQGLVII